LGPVIPFFLYISPFWNENVYFYPVHCILKVDNLFDLTGLLVEGICLRINHVLSLIHILFNETEIWTLEFMLELIRIEWMYFVCGHECVCQGR
jgi:hypothetical protein